MAKRITRTIITTVFNAVCVDLTTNTVAVKEVSLPSAGVEVTDDVKKAITDIVSPLALAAATVLRTEENLYAMPEQLFMAMATKLPPRSAGVDEE